MLLAAATAGVTSYAGAAQWAADLPERLRTVLGLGRETPGISTLRRTACRVDADVLDAVATAWLASQARPSGSADGPRVWALDGKSLRGARRADGRCEHLLAVVDHAFGAVLGQVAVGAKPDFRR